MGIDLGGTNLRAAGFDQRGQAGDLLSVAVDRDTAADRPFAQVARLVERVLEQRGGTPPRAIGLGATGPLDPVRGTIENPYTLPPAMQGPARAVLTAAFGVPVVIANDADAAALGEAWLGAGRGARSVACLTVGTGIGAGVVYDGVVHSGAGEAHPEAGHQIVDPSGPRCYCGAHGCVESLASATAIVSRARAAGIELGDAREFSAAVRAGDAACERIAASARSALVSAVRNLVAMHAVNVVVLAGNALGDPERVREAAQQAVDDFPFTPAGGTRVRLAELGDLAGCAGAARLALTA